MSILEGLGDIRHTEDSEPFVRNMDDYNEMMNKRDTMDRWIHIRDLFMAEYCKTGIVSAEGMDGIQVNTDTFLDMFPEHEVNPWILEGSQFTERLTAQYKGVTFFTIR